MASMNGLSKLGLPKFSDHMDPELSLIHIYGIWDSFSGQVFTEWRNDPAHYQDQRWTHVIAPFAIPKHWPIWRGYDFGFSKPFSVGWYAVDEEGRLYRIKELYGCTGRPNEGQMCIRDRVRDSAMKMTPSTKTASRASCQL